MNSAAPQIYFSYKWGGESEAIVGQIAAALEARGLPFVLDKVDLSYKGRIGAFMQEIGRGGAVVVVICDRYLTSPNTMYELVEMARHPDLHDRIFPVVLADAQIYDAVQRLKYVKHWEDRKRELEAAMRTVELTNLQGLTDDLNHYDNVRDQIAGLTALFKDLNTLTPEMHRQSGFASLVAALEQRLGPGTRPAVAAAAAPTQLALDLAADLTTMLNDPQAEGLMVHAATADGPVDVACVLVQADGSLACHLAAAAQLPAALRPSAQARRALMVEHGFQAPESEGGEFTLHSGDTEAAGVRELAVRLAGALQKAHGLSPDRLGWRLLPD